jgi:hypothetical protein
MNVYTVFAKADLQLEVHDWTKGLDYQVIEYDRYFTLASNQGSINYNNSAKEEVLANFKKEETE